MKRSKSSTRFQKQLSLFMATLLAWAMAVPALAAAGPNVRYGVRPIYPANQRSDKSGHFNLTMHTQQQQEIQVEIQNLGESPIYVEISANAAHTNGNGVMEYISASEAVLLAEADDQVQKPTFTTIVTAEEALIAVLPGETEKATFHIQMPAEPFEGVLMGGLYFAESLGMQAEMNAAQAPAEAQKKSGTGVMNRMAYVIPVVLRESETVPPPAFKLLGVYPDETYADALRIVLQNTEARISHLGNFEAKLFWLSEPQAPVETFHKAQIQMVPHARPALRFWRQSREPLAQGAYQLVVSFTCENVPYQLESIFSVE